MGSSASESPAIALRVGLDDSESSLFKSRRLIGGGGDGRVGASTSGKLCGTESRTIGLGLEEEMMETGPSFEILTRDVLVEWVALTDDLGTESELLLFALELGFGRKASY
jgi:hypothetical protein